jgi:hypothetical protein
MVRDPEAHIEVSFGLQRSQFLVLKDSNVWVVRYIVTLPNWPSSIECRIRKQPKVLKAESDSPSIRKLLSSQRKMKARLLVSRSCGALLLRQKWYKAIENRSLRIVVAKAIPARSGNGLHDARTHWELWGSDQICSTLGLSPPPIRLRVAGLRRIDTTRGLQVGKLVFWGTHSSAWANSQIFRRVF